MANILVIEDEAHILDDIAYMLQMRGYNVKKANNGDDGINIALEFLPDLIICDILMPGTDGYAVFEALHKEPSTMNTPFIFLTAKTSKEDRRLGMGLGADDYITKPYKIEELFSSISARLKKNRDIKKFYDSKMNELRHNISSTLPHELNTPLGTILGFSQWMISHLNEIAFEDIKVMIGGIYDSGKRLHRLIENYSFYASLLNKEAGIFYPTEEVVFSTSAVIKELCPKIANRFERSEDLELSLEDASIKFSEQYFRKIIEELCDNAFKFSTSGSKVRVEAKASNGKFSISFTDAGCGMTKQQINDIGGYMQFDRSLREQQGSGLGLAIVKKIADLNKSRLIIDSVPQNTKVCFEISC